MRFNAKVVNGILLASLLLVLPLAVMAATVPVDGLWQEFQFFGAGAPTIGCSPACFPSPSGNSEYAGDPPWTFTAPQSGAALTVVDVAASGDVFEVYDFDVLIGSTSASNTGTFCGLDPEVCLENPGMSSGVFILGSGEHEITIVPSASPFNVGAAYFRVTSDSVPGSSVEIDIKPGSDPNSINCSNMNEIITVAIITTEHFDAVDVIQSTISLEGASETHVNKNSGEPVQHEEDVDRDGDIDLVLHFRFGETTLVCDSTEGTLLGETRDGSPIEGTDAVRMVDSS